MTELTDYDKLRIEHARLEGAFKGFCEGLLFWELPEKLKPLIQAKLNELES